MVQTLLSFSLSLLFIIGCSQVDLNRSRVPSSSANVNINVVELEKGHLIAESFNYGGQVYRLSYIEGEKTVSKNKHYYFDRWSQFDKKAEEKYKNLVQDFFKINKLRKLVSRHNQIDRSKNEDQEQYAEMQTVLSYDVDNDVFIFSQANQALFNKLKNSSQQAILLTAILNKEFQRSGHINFEEKVLRAISYLFSDELNFDLYQTQVKPVFEK